MKLFSKEVWQSINDYAFVKNSIKSSIIKSEFSFCKLHFKNQHVGWRKDSVGNADCEKRICELPAESEEEKSRPLHLWET